MGEHVDVVVVGAGLSGIGAAYRLQTECPDRTFAILEARDAMGGTWDLFRYPGVRSDSDMFTLGYQFKPVDRARSRSPTRDTILGYIHETAAEFGIEQHIRYRTKVVGADWSSADARWTLRLETADGPSTMTCGFLYSCAGYFDYDRGHTPEFPGLEDFEGEVVHPQFWPEDLAYDDQRVVVIGSGATAVTLVPAMAERAAHVTMLQRSPTLDRRDPGPRQARRHAAREAAAQAGPPGHPLQEHPVHAGLLQLLPALPGPRPVDAARAHHQAACAIPRW